MSNLWYMYAMQCTCSSSFFLWYRGTLDWSYRFINRCLFSKEIINNLDTIVQICNYITLWIFWFTKPCSLVHFWVFCPVKLLRLKESNIDVKVKFFWMIEWLSVLHNYIVKLLSCLCFIVWHFCIAVCYYYYHYFIVIIYHQDSVCKKLLFCCILQYHNRFTCVPHDN